MWAAAATALALASRQLKARADDRLVPLMGMLGAFVFAAQMINFSIPGTGSSGHLGGGLLLAILLGPHAALVVISSVLTVQALFFADGGLLALGANIFNLGVLPCMVAYPLVYRPLAGRAPSPRRMSVAAVLAAVAALQLGAMGVVLQTVASGISALPLHMFAWLMLPIHAAIGLVEGLATAALVGFVMRQRPGLLQPDAWAPPATAQGRPTLRPVLATTALLALLVGGVGSWFASTQPDGLEWSVAHASGGQQVAAPARGLHAALAQVQAAVAWLPGYGWPGTEAAVGGTQPAAPMAAAAPAPTTSSAASATPVAPTAPVAPVAPLAPLAPVAAAPWPAVDLGASLAGVLGGSLTLALVSGVALLLRRRKPAPG
jgi:cobalt/nickel transport system permease protein